MQFTELSKNDSRLRAKLIRVREGIAAGMSLKPAHIDVLLSEQKLTNDDPLAQRGYFGVCLFRGRLNEKNVMFHFMEKITVPRMIRAAVGLPLSSWATKSESNKPRPIL